MSPTNQFYLTSPAFESSSGRFALFYVNGQLSMVNKKIPEKFTIHH